MAPTIYRYTGRRRTGATVDGRFAGDPERFVQSRFERGWLQLTAWSGSDQIGRIYLDPENGRRVWWAESALS